MWNVLNGLFCRPYPKRLHPPYFPGMVIYFKRKLCLVIESQARVSLFLNYYISFHVSFLLQRLSLSTLAMSCSSLRFPHHLQFYKKSSRKSSWLQSPSPHLLLPLLNIWSPVFFSIVFYYFHSLLFTLGPIVHSLYGPESLWSVVDGCAERLPKGNNIFRIGSAWCLVKIYGISSRR